MRCSGHHLGFPHDYLLHRGCKLSQTSLLLPILCSSLTSKDSRSGTQLFLLSYENLRLHVGARIFSNVLLDILEVCKSGSFLGRKHVACISSKTTYLHLRASLPEKISAGIHRLRCCHSFSFINCQATHECQA